MKNEILINRIQRRLAQISVSSSSLRNQGAKGIIGICRKYFEYSIDLIEFRQALESDDFKSYLDMNTDYLIEKFPEFGKSWGAARKGLNLFFREVVYNFYIANYIEIPSDKDKNVEVLKHLEIPLDKDVATGLLEIYPELPKWKSLKSLTPKESEFYQNRALKNAEELRVPRIHLDLKFWRREK